jgi:hypothetical protein
MKNNQANCQLPTCGCFNPKGNGTQCEGCTGSCCTYQARRRGLLLLLHDRAGQVGLLVYHGRLSRRRDRDVTEMLRSQRHRTDLTRG